MRDIFLWLTKHTFVSFVLLNLAPIILIIILSSLLTVLLGGFSLFGLAIEALAFSIFLIPLVFGLGICYLLFKQTESGFVRGFILYAFWMITIYIAIYLLVGALSFGAIVDFGHDPALYDQPFFLPNQIIIWGSIVSLAWIVICLSLMRRFTDNGKIA